MSAAVSITPTSGNIISVETACEVRATGLTVNDSTTYDVNASPSEDPFVYYFKLSKSGSDDLISPVFSASATGTAEWHDIIPTAAGSWTLGVYDNDDDSSVVTTSVTVS